MIHLNIKKFSRLKGHKKFRSKTRTEENERKKVQGLTQAAEEEFERRVIALKITVRQVKLIPCDANLQVGCQAGKPVTLGRVYAPDKASFHNLEELIPQIINASYELARDFPTASYVLRYHQVVDFTDIE